MTTNPILKKITGILLICFVLVFSRCKHSVADKDGINSFLSLISLEVQNAQTDSLMKNFDMRQKTTVIRQLVNILCNKSGITKNSTPIFKLSMDMEANALEDGGPDITNATIPVTLSRDTLDIKPTTTTLSLKIRRVANSTYKIVDVDATKLIKEYVGYENLVRGKILSDKDIYSPQTLAAFKVAKGLKSKYDSIPWFQHIGAATWYFVVKGKFNLDAYSPKDTIPTYKMGLVDSAQKEIIPVAYDLIHNIGATFPNMIEVEKDHKRGFFNLTGQPALPVEYDQVFPVNDADNMAVLRKGSDYFWWKKDGTVSAKDADIKIAEVLPRIQFYGKSAKLNGKVMENVMEYNSREEHGSIYIAPSYMVDWALLPQIQNFKNPLRKNIDYEGVSDLYELAFDGKMDSDSWLSSVFYSIRDNYLGGRSGLYTHKNVLIVNKKNNRIYGHDITTYYGDGDGGEEVSSKCDISALTAINDSLYEVKAGAIFYKPLYDGSVVTTGPAYHYLELRNDKLIEKPNDRLFGFTKYVKMNDKYLYGCYEFWEKTGSVNMVTPEMLKMMKNEIYAEYKYRFKDAKWALAFGQSGSDSTSLHNNVDDSLTVIDKYNIAFINKKLKELSGNSKALAAK